MVVILSTYELGRPAFGPALAAAWMREAGLDARLVDLSREPSRPALVAGRISFAVHVPMHAATRLAGPVLSRLRDERPDAPRVAFGLYAPLNADWLRRHGATHVLGVEAEAALAALAAGKDGRRARSARHAGAPARVPRPGPVDAAAALGLRAPQCRWRAPPRGLHRGLAWLPAYLHALPDRADLPGQHACRAGRDRACRRRPAGRGRRAAHHVRRPGFPQWPDTCAPRDRGPDVAASRRQLRRDHQGRAPARASRSARPARRHALRLRHLRRRGVRRRGARASPEGPHGRRRAPRHRGVPGPWPRAGADVRGVHAVDDASRLTWPFSKRFAPSTWWTSSRRCSWRCGCCCRRVRRCWPTRTCSASPVPSTPTPSRIHGHTSTRPSIACRSSRWRGSASRAAAPHAPRAYAAMRRMADEAAGTAFDAFAPGDALVRATVPYLDEPWYC